ncbi:MAG: hypothetical protein AAGK21_11815 [Bacteroidota bacterium]
MAVPTVRESIFVTATPAVEMARRLREGSNAILASMGASAGDPAWRETSEDTFETEWNGARLGPSTHTRHEATRDDWKAVVTLDVIRWDPDHVARYGVGGTWTAGRQRTSCAAGTSDDRPIKRFLLTGPPEAVRQLRTVVGERPMDDGFLVRLRVDSRLRAPYERILRCPSAHLVDQALSEDAPRWQTVLDIRRADAPAEPGVSADAWRAGERP